MGGVTAMPVLGPAEVDVSVVLCTRNRCDALAMALDQQARLAIPPGVRWESIVVDNGSTDDTPRVLAERAALLPLRVVREPTTGLSRARNAGLAAAGGALVLCTDDDCLCDTRWLWTIWEEFQNRPDLDVLGGRVELFDARDRPTTIRTSRDRARIDDPYGLSILIGCNIAFRRRAIETIGPFDIALGGGTPARAGEDTDYFYRALQAGLMIEYSPDVLVYHNHGRRTDRDARALTRAYTVARGALFCKYIPRRVQGKGMRARAYADLAFHAKLVVSDLKARRFPRSTLRHYRYLAEGAFYWMRHRIRELGRRERDASRVGVKVSHREPAR